MNFSFPFPWEAEKARHKKYASCISPPNRKRDNFLAPGKYVESCLLYDLALPTMGVRHHKIAHSLPCPTMTMIENNIILQKILEERALSWTVPEKQTVISKNSYFHSPKNTKPERMRKKWIVELSFCRNNGVFIL